MIISLIFTTIVFIGAMFTICKVGAKDGICKYENKDGEDDGFLSDR